MKGRVVPPHDDVCESLDLIDAIGVPSPELARRIVRLLNLPAVVERRLTALPAEQSCEKAGGRAA